MEADKLGRLITINKTQNLMRNIHHNVYNNPTGAITQSLAELMAPLPPALKESFDRGDNGFVYSRSHACKLLAAYGFTHRAVETRARYDTIALLAFGCLLVTLVKEFKLGPDRIVNTDETGITQGCKIPKSYTRGVEAPKLSTTSDVKRRLTAILTIAMNGDFYTPYLIIKGKHDEAKKHNAINYMLNEALDVFKFDSQYTLLTRSEHEERERAIKLMEQMNATGAQTKATGASHNKNTTVLSATSSSNTVLESDDDLGFSDSSDNEESDSPAPSSRKRRKKDDEPDDDDYDVCGGDDFAPELKVKDGKVNLENIFTEDECEAFEKAIKERYLASLALDTSRQARHNKNKVINISWSEFPVDDTLFTFFTEILNDVGIEQYNQEYCELASDLESLLLNDANGLEDFLKSFLFQVKKLCPNCPQQVLNILKSITSLPQACEYIINAFNEDHIVNIKEYRDDKPQSKSSDIWLAKHHNAWTTEPTLRECLNTTVFPRTQQLQGEYLYLMDNFSCHRRPDIMKSITTNKGILLFFPANCTSLLQPLDLRPNAHVKQPMTSINGYRHDACEEAGGRIAHLYDRHRMMLNIGYSCNLVSRPVVISGFRLMLENLLSTVTKIKETPDNKSKI